ncbi:hypothetical protein [Kibdelosporangium aridum]|uniref:hypothetical protein n=1 Tax=Kibdelosporangium aridum TaxID=2030 RepID=UPI000A968527|nr:hypothetical protein [Kibdelosporangium aridum]
MTSLVNTAGRRTRRRGGIDILPSGSLRVRVYAGLALDTRRPRYLSETVPSGPDAEQKAEQARLRLICTVDKQRGLWLNATLDELITRHIALMPGATTTKTTYRSYHNNPGNQSLSVYGQGMLVAQTTVGRSTESPKALSARATC